MADSAAFTRLRRENFGFPVIVLVEGQEGKTAMLYNSPNGYPMAAKRKPIANTKVDLYEKLLARFPEIERKGDANPYTALNGNMFTLLHQSETLAIRLPAAEREKFLKRYKTRLFEAYGAVMKEYVEVPDSLLARTAELSKYLDLSHAYAKTLKPKPTKKSKA